MNRLGFRAEQFADAYARLTRVGNVASDPTLVTHLATLTIAGMPRPRSSCRLSRRRLPRCKARAASPIPRALLAWPDTRADWVRPGLVLYGLSPFASGTGADLGLRPVMTLQTEVIAVKDVRQGQTVGYGGAWRAARDTRMAVVAAGYGDGYPRSVESGTPLLVNGGARRSSGGCRWT